MQHPQSVTTKIDNLLAQEGIRAVAITLDDDRSATGDGRPDIHARVVVGTDPRRAIVGMTIAMTRILWNSGSTHVDAFMKDFLPGGVRVASSRLGNASRWIVTVLMTPGAPVSKSLRRTMLRMLKAIGDRSGPELCLDFEAEAVR